MLHPDTFAHVHAVSIELSRSRNDSETNNSNNKIYDSDVGDIHLHFSRFGDVLAVNIHADLKGAFVIFDLEDSLIAAVSAEARSAESELHLRGVSFPLRVTRVG